jgi:hypothetical protein
VEVCLPTFGKMGKIKATFYCEGFVVTPRGLQERNSSKNGG